MNPAGAVWPCSTDVSYAMWERNCLTAQSRDGALSEEMNTRSASNWRAIGSFFSGDSFLSTRLTSPDRAIGKYVNKQEKMLLRITLYYFYPMMSSRKCLGRMNFVKLKEPRVEWLASKNDTSLKQPCSQLRIKARLNGNCDYCDFKEGWKWRAKVNDGLKLHHLFFHPFQGKDSGLESIPSILPTVQNTICIEKYWYCGFWLLWGSQFLAAFQSAVFLRPWKDLMHWYSGSGRWKSKKKRLWGKGSWLKKDIWRWGKQKLISVQRNGETRKKD